MHTRRVCRRAAVTVLLIALACGLSDGPARTPPRGLDPVPTPPGVPVGPATKATISPAGGTLTTADGALSIEVPAGAVSAPTEIGITRITNNAVGAVAGAFRLTPDGTTFDAPVRLTFRGPTYFGPSGGIEDVGVVYQDRTGLWIPVGPATRDAVANTITVETDHFSDWTLTWQTGTPTAEGPIQLSQTYGIPFSAEGRATVYLRDDGAAETAYVLAGTLTVPASFQVGDDVCIPDETTKSWINTAEIDKARDVFRWGIGVSWKLTCTAPGGAVTERSMPALFDTMGINLTRCLGAYDPGQFAEREFLQGGYRADCGVDGAVRATWELRGYQILVEPTSGLITTEAGGTATFQMVLSNPPTADVVVGVSSSSPEGTASPGIVTFTPSDWDTPHVVTVTGADDFVVDGEVAYTILTLPAVSDDPRYYGMNPPDVQVTNLDNDVAGLSTSPASGLVTTEAGGTATLQVALSSQPIADVVVTVSSSDATEGTVSPATLTFTPAGWNVPQQVTVAGVDDAVADGAIAYAVQLSAASADPLYQGRGASVAVTNQDDDVAGFRATPAAGLSTTEAGGTAVFQLALTSEPSADVTVTLASEDPSEGTVSPATVVFTAATWNVPQPITITGVDDLLADGPVSYAIRFTGASGDAGYAGRAGAVTVTNADDDVAGLVATPSSGLLTTEAGGTATFQVRLSSQPLADVVITLSSSDATEGTVAPGTLTFTAASWDVPQAVTATGVDDAVVDGAIAYAVQLSAASADAGYAGRAASVAVTNADDDLAAIQVGTPSSTTTTEAGGTATFTVALSSQPTADVTVPLSSTDATEGAVSPASFVFTAADWNQPRTVTVTGVDDLVADGAQAYAIAIGPASSADPSYQGRAAADLGFTNTDDDVAGIVVGAPSTTVTTEAGGTATFSVVLTSQPTSDVTIPLSSSDATEGLVSPASLVFTATDWSVPRTVTVTGVDDLVVDGAQAYAVHVGPASSADAEYQGRAHADVPFTNADDDTAAIAVEGPSGITTTEAGSAVTFTLVLTSQPTADVTIPLSSDDPTEGVVSPASLVFTAADWNVPRTVTVTGVDDAVADGNQLYGVVIGMAASADPAYAGIDPADLLLTNLDDDTAGIVATPSSGLTTTEAGGTATFEVTLASEPTAEVVVAVWSDTPAEGIAAPDSLTFGPADWNVPRTVTVTGVDDLIVDGPIPYTVRLSASSADPGYAGAAAAVSVTNLDND